jgi:hypothetical protein
MTEPDIKFYKYGSTGSNEFTTSRGASNMIDNPKKVDGWWFTKEKRLPNGDGRKIKLGITHKVKGELVPCKWGLHLSIRIIDALRYASGPIIYRVQGSGVVIPHGNPIDKYCCSERTYLSGGIDCSDILRKFRRLCALDVIHLWKAPDIVIKYLKTGDENIRAAARETAWMAIWESKASVAAVWAAWAATGEEWEAWEAWLARSAAAVAGVVAVTAWLEAWEIARKKQDRRLTRMVQNAFRKGMLK